MGNIDWFGRARLASGLTLFAFVSMHLLNHALGLISLDAMELGRIGFLYIWRSLPGTVLLYLALLTHLSLVLTSIYRKRGWRQVAWAEFIQIGLGLSVPILVAQHAVANRGANAMFGIEDTYAFVLLALWDQKPHLGFMQCVAIVVAWTHGCMGVHFWLRLKPAYAIWRRVLYPIAILLPTFAIVGFVDAGRQFDHLMTDPIYRERLFAPFRALDPAAPERIGDLIDRVWIGFGMLLATLFLARLAREGFERRRGFVTLTYPEGRLVSVRTGTSVLEASRLAGIPHASVCGGRGRCSTCRVRLGAGQEALPEPDEEEVRVLKRVAAPQTVRLACQIRPSADLQVTPLLAAATAAARDGYQAKAYTQGSEREIAILFADLRAFTKFSEKKLPYDVVFVINQYFRAMGEAIETAGGHVDKFIGDGVMALFGLESDSAKGCRDALSAARGMAAALTRLNETLANDLSEPLRIGIGIHAGTVIVGEMGHGRAVSVTAIGDAVNTASRLESMTKEFGVQLVVSKRVSKRAGVNLKTFARREIDIRGRVDSMPVFLIENALDLEIALAAPPVEA